MSSASSDLLPLSDLLKSTGEKQNVLWIDTYYFDLKPNTITNMPCKFVWNSGKIQLKYCDIVIEFRFARTGDMEYRFTCMRTPVSPPLNNYTLEFHCSINVFDQDPTVLILQSDQPNVIHTYDLNSCCIPSNGYTTELELKVFVKMIEYDCDPSLAHPMQEEELLRKKQQELEFHQMKEIYFNDETVLNDLLYLLHISKFEEIFTGRQNNEFAKLKSLYITRTAIFSRKIAKYKMTNGACSPLSSADLGIILNFILSASQKQINDQDLFKVYCEAHRMGLHFLVDLSRDAISDRIGNQNFMDEALVVADSVGDNILFEKVAEHFYNSRKMDQLSLDFLERVRKFGCERRFMILSLRRQMRKIKEKKESENHVKTGESSQPSTSK